VGWDSPLGTAATTGLFYQPRMVHDECEAVVGMRIGKETCPSATLFTTNPTLPDPGSNPGPHGGKPAANRLSYGATYVIITWVLYSAM
jgi:hypothetical protein